MFRSKVLIPVGVTLFGNQAFAGVSKLGGGHTRGGGANSDDYCPYEDDILTRDTAMLPSETEVEVRVMRPQA